MILLCSFVALFVGSINAQSKTNPLDRKVLDYIYNANDDRTHKLYNWTNWRNSSGTSDPCTDNWHGITCVKNQSVYYVSGINLPSHGLWSLPDEITEMKHLRTLVIAANYIGSSDFPEGIFAIQTLEYFDASYMHSFNISLPRELSLPNLQQLHASKSKITGLLPITWNTPKLENILLDGNNLEGYLPDGIGKIAGLKELKLQENRLTGNFPQSYGNLHQLVNLSLVQSSHTLCPGIPDTWQAMFSLEYASICVFGHLPDFIGENWQQLKTFRITGSSYEGNITASLCKLTQLQHLDLSNNHFTGIIPECLFSMSSLVYLDLSYNQLSGAIPEAIGTTANIIERLLLSHNRLNSTLPRSIGKLTSIVYLELENNLLTGAIPTEFDELRNIGHPVIMVLRYNMLSSFEDGLEYFFRDIQGNYYENPFECPLPTYIREATCSLCNSGTKHNSCEECVSASGCGWCSYGPNCVEGTHQGPVNQYSCPEDWSFGTCHR
ncbi:uncharacterized protein [Dysidea avara]|uniref:uncharacterized protein n=1 Tax=Dysidea avara TaxID=196820 RepID=UPI003328056B